MSSLAIARLFAPEVATPVAAPSFDEVYTRHVAYVWRVLRTLGVATAQLEDAAQDVFVIVHRRLGEFEGRAAMTTWLFAIARRVASTYRRREEAARRPAPAEAEAGPAPDAFDELARAEAAAAVMAILERMDEEKRIVFALVELEQQSVADVARALGVGLNTTYSRLRLARREFEAAVRTRGGQR
jgi:RNA polymerase sigma-70 factor (ECF subfamily)